MPTKSLTLDDLRTPIQEDPTVATAQRALAKAYLQRDELARMAKIYRTRLIAPWPEGVTFTDAEIVEARAHIYDTETALGRAQMDVMQGEQQHRAAEADAKARRDAALRTIESARLIRFNHALTQCKTESDAVRDVRNVRHEVLGEYNDPLHWQEFGERYERWREIVTGYGYRVE